MRIRMRITFVSPPTLQVWPAVASSQKLVSADTPTLPTPKLVKYEDSDKLFPLFSLLPPGITVKNDFFKITSIWRMDLVLCNLTKVRLSPQQLCFSWAVAITHSGASRSPALGLPDGSTRWTFCVSPQTSAQVWFRLMNSMCGGVLFWVWTEQVNIVPWKWCCRLKHVGCFASQTDGRCAGRLPARRACM